jgi:predicted methyltransferase
MKKGGGYFMKLTGKAIKAIGIVASVVGAVATLAGNWAGEKQQEAKIAEKVAEVFAKTTDGES